MEENKNTHIKTISVVLLITALLLAGGAYFYKYKIKSTSTNSSDTASTTDIIVPGLGDLHIKGSGGFTVKEITDNNVSVKAPDFYAPLKFSASIPDDIRLNLNAAFEDTVAKLKSNPKDFNSIVKIGILRKGAGDYLGAAEVWEYAVIIYPKNLVTYRNLGDLYENFLKDYPKAEKNLKIAIANEPYNASNYRALYELYSGPYIAKSAEAPQVLKDGLKNIPGNFDLTLLLAYYYEKAGDKDKAKVYFGQALSIAEKEGRQDRVNMIQLEIIKLGQ